MSTQWEWDVAHAANVGMVQMSNRRFAVEAEERASERDEERERRVQERFEAHMQAVNEQNRLLARLVADARVPAIRRELAELRERVAADNERNELRRQLAERKADTARAIDAVTEHLVKDAAEMRDKLAAAERDRDHWREQFGTEKSMRKDEREWREQAESKLAEAELRGVQAERERCAAWLTKLGEETGMDATSRFDVAMEGILSGRPAPTTNETKERAKSA